MKHTSVRLSDDHAARIAETGESPSDVIRKALDLYFGIDNLDPIHRMVEEAMKGHMERYHKDEHIMSTSKLISASMPQDVPQNEHKDVPIIAHDVSTKAQSEHNESTDVKPALAFILQEFQNNREPLTADVAKAVGMNTVIMGMALGELGIKSKNTTRHGKNGRYYTFAMKKRIEEILDTHLPTVRVEEMHKDFVGQGLELSSGEDVLKSVKVVKPISDPDYKTLANE